MKILNVIFLQIKARYFSNLVLKYVFEFPSWIMFYVDTQFRTMYQWCNMLKATEHRSDSLETFFHSVIRAILSENFSNSLDLSLNPCLVLLRVTLKFTIMTVCLKMVRQAVSSRFRLKIDFSFVRFINQLKLDKKIMLLRHCQLFCKLLTPWQLLSIIQALTPP